ncbi:BTB/POZ domain-containing protein At1g67900 [Olea europaea subsp. europaea]|uniref:BTB/POZ domain-containing protein At1g67900 n=1 Tax=Olea europaea subsp. europaea TaxID=158383 RepID=A0A8S0QDR0_OLEEU|nr:BTB/POZ domain-containing protein At1g67900 [Olea europaea subsp. europaea]
MKFMKLGTRPDTFYTEEAASILLFQRATYYNSIAQTWKKKILATSPWSYMIFLVETRLLSCVQVITINLGAHNFVPALCLQVPSND